MPNKKRDSSHFIDDLPWTTARCHRLIRPIASTINALRELEETERMRVSSSLNAYAPKEQDFNITRRECRENARDLDWGSQVPRKRLKRTYSKQERERHTESTTLSHKNPSSSYSRIARPGEIIIQTPFLTRNTSIFLPRSQAVIRHTKPTVRKKLNTGTIPDGAHGSAYSLQKNTLYIRLRAAFGKVLDVTSQECENDIDIKCGRTEHPIGATPSSGSRSLLSLCLRSIPAYIKAEESYLDGQEDNNNIDVAADIYAELEGLGTAPGRGWKHLREVVRAHAVSLLRTAVEEFRLTWSFVADFQYMSQSHGAYSEAENLFSSYAAAQGQLALPHALNKGMPSTVSDEDILAPRKSVPQNKPLDPFWSIRSHCDERLINNDEGSRKQKRRQSRAPEVDLHNEMLQAVFSGYRNVLDMSYHQIANLLASRRLPLEWLATSYAQAFWKGILSSVSDGGDRHFSASRLISTTITIACDLRVGFRDVEDCSRPCNEQWQEALDNTITSLCIILTSVAIIEHGVAGENMVGEVSDRIIYPIRVATMRIICDLNRQSNSNIQSRTLLMRMVVLATDLVLSIVFQFRDYNTGKRFAERLEQLSLLSDRISALETQDRSGVETISNLICSIAQCLARARHDLGYEFLHCTLARLLAYHPRSTSTTSANVGYAVSSPRQSLAQRSLLFTKQLALDSAMLFASRCSTAKAYVLVNLVESSIARCTTSSPTRNPITRTPARRSRGKSGYRWEQGICEWVSTTPAPHCASRTTSVVDILPDTVEDTPQDFRTPISTSVLRPVLTDNINGATTKQLVAEPKFSIVIPFKNNHECNGNRLDKENFQLVVPFVKICAEVQTRSPRCENIPLPRPISRSHNVKKPCTNKGVKHLDQEESSEDELSFHEIMPSYAMLGSQKSSISVTIPSAMGAAPKCGKRSIPGRATLPRRTLKHCSRSKGG